MMSGLQRRWWVLGLALALGVVLFTPLASSHPDGLERVAEDVGFIERAQESPYELVPDYLFPGIDNEAVATVLAGLIGTGLLFGLAYGLAWVLRRRPDQRAS
jgi:hypothetical protein